LTRGVSQVPSQPAHTLVTPSGGGAALSVTARVTTRALWTNNGELLKQLTEVGGLHA
jgi:hypothetical protein